MDLTSNLTAGEIAGSRIGQARAVVCMNVDISIAGSHRAEIKDGLAFLPQQTHLLHFHKTAGAKLI